MAVDKPSVDDLVGWLKLESAPDAPTMAVYAECFDAALDDIESRINLPAGTTDADYPQRVRTAILLMASRLAKRSTSPEGVAGMSELGIAIRILSNDPDIERLIRRFLKLDGFA